MPLGAVAFLRSPLRAFAWAFPLLAFAEVEDQVVSGLLS